MDQCVPYLCHKSLQKKRSWHHQVYSEVAGSRSALARAKLKEEFGHVPPESPLSCDFWGVGVLAGDGTQEIKTVTGIAA